MELFAEIPCRAELAEGVLWHPQQERLWWTDILGCRLYCASLNGEHLLSYPTPEPLTAFGFTKESGRLIASFSRGIAYFWPEQERVEWLSQPDIGQAERFNDGRVSPDGQFWAGTLAPNVAGGAELYRFDGKLCRQLDQLTIANGLCWSVGADYLYHADSPERTIRRFPYQAGQIAGPGEVFVTTAPGEFPDGAVVDADNNLWAALWGGSRVVAYNCKGAEIESVHLPVSQPTCVAFAGPALDYLVVTSAWEHMSADQRAVEPRAGNVFVYKTGYRGRACEFFACV